MAFNQYKTPIQILWRPGVATVVPNTLTLCPPFKNPSCSTLNLTVPPTATLDTILVE